MIFTEKKLLAGALIVAMVIFFMPLQQVSAASKPGKVANFKATNVTQTSVTLKWDKVNKAKGYVLYEKQSGKYKKLAKVSGTAYVVMNLDKSTSYTFKVNAYKKTGKRYMYGKGTTLNEMTSEVGGIIKSWNIGGNGKKLYSPKTATSSVKVSLYDDGKLLISGSGNTAVFAGMKNFQLSDDYLPPWVANEKYDDFIKSAEIETTVTPSNMDFWFWIAKNLTAAPAVPSSVTSLNNTFAGTAITVAPAIPSGVTQMSNAFELTSITVAPTLPDSLTIMNGTFSQCKKLKEMPKIPEGVIQMDGCFMYCTSMTTATAIPKDVVSMDELFNHCSSLTGTVTFYNTAEDYDECFYAASTKKGTMLTVNYGSSCSNINKVIKTKSSNSNIVKGKLVSK